jgi:hypothetical protein
MQQHFGGRRASSALKTSEAYLRDENGRYTLLGSPGGAIKLRWRPSSRGILRHGNNFAKFNALKPWEKSACSAEVGRSHG